MTSVDHAHALLPDSAEFAALLAEIGAGASDRDRNDENPFDQVIALKRAGFGALRLPERFGGPGLTVPQLFSTIIDVARADPIVAHIFRTHFWFVEERLRTADEPTSQAWLAKEFLVEFERDGGEIRNGSDLPRIARGNKILDL
ncbi:acyl-CoA dehydrogenase family protein, partial [Mycolicibacterium chubuense]